MMYIRALVFCLSDSGGSFIFFSPVGCSKGSWALCRITCGWCCAGSEWAKRGGETSGRCNYACEGRRTFSFLTSHWWNKLQQIEAGRLQTYPGYNWQWGKNVPLKVILSTWSLCLCINSQCLPCFLILSQQKEDNYELSYLWPTINTSYTYRRLESQMTMNAIIIMTKIALIWFQGFVKESIKWNTQHKLKETVRVVVAQSTMKWFIAYFVQNETMLRFSIV